MTSSHDYVRILFNSSLIKKILLLFNFEFEIVSSTVIVDLKFATVRRPNFNIFDNLKFGFTVTSEKVLDIVVKFLKNRANCSHS
jgi:hypothetical protein